MRLRQERLETRRQQIDARQRFSRLHARRGSSLKVWQEYLDAAKKVMAENDPKRFLRENQTLAKPKNVPNQAVRNLSINAMDVLENVVRFVLNGIKKCVTIEHPERGNWRLTLRHAEKHTQWLPIM